jgi:hypothetical protein
MEPGVVGLTVTSAVAALAAVRKMVPALSRRAKLERRVAWEQRQAEKASTPAARKAWSTKIEASIGLLTQMDAPLDHDDAARENGRIFVFLLILATFGSLLAIAPMIVISKIGGMQSWVHVSSAVFFIAGSCFCFYASIGYGIRAVRSKTRTWRQWVSLLFDGPQTARDDDAVQQDVASRRHPQEVAAPAAASTLTRRRRTGGRPLDL